MLVANIESIVATINVTIELPILVNNRKKILTLKDILLIPSSASHLFYINRAWLNKARTVQNNKEQVIVDIETKEIIAPMAKNNVTNEMNIVEDKNCSTCPVGHGTRVLHTTPSNLVANEVGGVVDIDLVGPIAPPSLAGKRYAVLSKDSNS